MLFVFLYCSTDHPYQYELEMWEPADEQLQAKKEQVNTHLEGVGPVRWAADDDRQRNRQIP